MKVILFSLFILFIICFIFKNKDGFCLNDGDADQEMLDNIVATCPPNLGVNDLRDMYFDDNHVNDNCLCSIKFLLDNCRNKDGDTVRDISQRFNDLFENTDWDNYNRPVTWNWLQDYNQRWGGAQYISGDLNCRKIRGTGTTNISPPGEDHDLCHDKETLNRFARFKYEGGDYDDREICVSDEALQNNHCIYERSKHGCEYDSGCLTIQCPNNDVVVDWQPHESCRDNGIREKFSNLPRSSGYYQNEICVDYGSEYSTLEECLDITNRNDCLYGRGCEPLTCL